MDRVLDIKRLRVLKEVVETGSVSAAAAVLNYTPSAISQQVTALERETGTVLLEQAGRGVRPTAAALLLCDHAARVLAAMDEAEDALAALRAGHAGRVRVGAFPTAGASLVPQALASFERRLPNVRLDLVVAETDEALASLRDGSIDVAVVIESSSDKLCSDGLYRHHLLSDPFRVVLPRGHPMAGRRTVDLGALAHDRWVGISTCPGYCQQVVTAACRQAGFEPSYGLEADEYPTAQAFVAAGLGVMLAPLLALGPAAHTGVVVRRVKGGQPAREVWAVTRPALAEQLPVRAMLDELQSSARQFVTTRD
jgi:DNA-binding transcriptional LysR family regulator